MCDQCTTEALRYGDEVLPGFWLMKAQKQGLRWNADDWGLVECNDPTITWTSDPQPSPTYGLSDQEEEKWYEDNKADRQLIESTMKGPSEDFKSALRLDPQTGHRMVEAGRRKGYDPDRSGDFAWWLWETLGEHLRTAVPVHHGAH